MTKPVRIPILGHIARDIDRDVNIVFYLLIIALTLLVLAVKTWGLVALVMVCLALVPVVFVLLIGTTLP